MDKQAKSTYLGKVSHSERAYAEILLEDEAVESLWSAMAVNVSELWRKQIQKSIACACDCVNKTPSSQACLSHKNDTTYTTPFEW